MRLPERPQLEHRQREGRFGEVVEELTPESEKIWAEYLRNLHFAKAAIFNMEIEKQDEEE